ncbi:Sporulation domain protein [Alkaliphilus metalliredigens QYMF]|uniref:Sporulation domain protein n=1 Tax=Alkaliphilus metalliredigens (strain QYMF) TaxID=293826 RepID=A6TQG3_ALKMQ|nr:hypothetical protein [Alkaliphilus metalliredigens]ABR48431.1 Sporulation domain protein [Alkaliphilus metalliredigens QYMF]
MKRKKFGMKYNKTSKAQYLLAFLFCLILPAMAILIGLHITENLVMPTLNPQLFQGSLPVEEGVGQETEEDHNGEDEVEEGSIGADNEIEGTDETPKDDIQTYSTEIKGVSIYLIQVASIGDTSNIEDFVGELNNHNLSHLIYQMDDSYKVYTLGFAERSQIENRLPFVREKYPDAYITEIRLPDRKVAHEDKNSETVIQDVNLLTEILRKQSQEWYNFLQKEGELTFYGELLQEQRLLLSKLSQTIENDFSERIVNKDVFEKMIHYQKSNTDRSLESLEDMDNEYLLHSMYLDSLFRLIEVIKG